MYVETPPTILIILLYPCIHVLTLCHCFQPRDDVYGAYDNTFMQDNGPKQNTQSPIVTGTSVVGIKFKDGVVIAADNLGPLPFIPA